MKIDYKNILNKNMINVFKDVLIHIEKNGFQENHHLYITFETNNSKVKIPKWLKEKFKSELTIVIQYEYWNFRINKNYFSITLSFDNIRSDLEIPFSSVISFADPYAKFGLQLITKTSNAEKKDKKDKKELDKKKEKIIKKIEKNNIINFKNYKKD